MQAIQQRTAANLFGPTLLIGLGLLLLLSNLGYLSFDVWVVMVQLWPLLLIAIGINLLVGRNASWVGVVIALVLILIVLATALIVPGRLGTLSGLGDPVTIAQPFQNLERAEVTITSSVGHLSLDAAATPGQLISGTITPLRTEKISTNYQQSGDVGRYSVESKGTVNTRPFFWGSPSENMWDLHLSPKTSINLNLSTGVGLSEIDLRSLTIRNLSVNAGVGKVEIVLPAQGDLHGDIQAGVGQVIVRIPASMAARIDANAGLGGVHVEGALKRTGDRYTTDNYPTAANKVTLTVEGGVGEVRIEQINE